MPIAGIAALAIFVAICMILLIQKPAVTKGILAVMAFQFAFAATGLLRHWDWTPPPFLPMMLVTFALTIWLAWKGTPALSFAVLIGLQAFRLPLELVMHQAAVEGIMPVQMSYAGRNFFGCNRDILTGITAIPVAWLAWKGLAPRWLIIAWNGLGSVLLLNIVTIAVLSIPSIAFFGRDHLNTWVADPPYVWLPGVLVQAALWGHISIWKKLYE